MFGQYTETQADFWGSVRDAAHREFEEWVESVTGDVYDAIPVEIRDRLEREYVRQRAAEEVERARRAAQRATPYVPLAIALGALFLFFR